MASRLVKNSQGFSLVEVMIVAGILTIVFTGLIQVFIYCSTLSNYTGNMMVAMNAAQSKFEEMHNANFTNLTTNYASGGSPGNTFTISNPSGMGIIYINSTNSDLYVVTINVSWLNKDKRVVGEDTNLNGVLDAGEDVNSNAMLDSPASIVGMIAKR